MIYAVVSLAVLGAIFGLVLGFAGKKFAVEVDPRIESILNTLPGANCGACGFPGCAGYAEAIINAGAPMNACSPGKDAISKKIAEIMGAEAGKANERKIAQLLCNGGIGNAVELYHYEGIKDCHSVATMYNGPKICNYGCFGQGTCAAVCPFGAITMGAEGLPLIDPELCTGCNACVRECPQKILQTVEISKLVHVRCHNKDKGKDAKAACKVACIKCKICEKNCPEDAIHVVADSRGSVAVIDYAKCTSCGICVEKCPTKTIEKVLPTCADLPERQDKFNPENPTCVTCGICK
ncbi:MAG: RnfABCDGE type electron transport complex subunit B [Clostridia bacterium]|jgi:Na+-translocating ferredoxin:NAD+ oxidoreductase RNF subunit RnfB|nr:RnfABCDGE type electron transport complex subunit B [Clostridia bacterium]